MCEPLLAALAARGERLSVAALAHVAPVFRFMPMEAEIVELPFAHGRLDLAARFRQAGAWKGRFDSAYVLPNSIKSALVPWLAGIPRRVGYRGEGRGLLLTESLPNPPRRQPMVARYTALAGAGFDAAAWPRLVVAESASEGALQRAALERGRYWVLSPGAEFGPAKRWPADRYALLAKNLHARDGSPVALLGSPSERALCESIAAAAGDGSCRVLAGPTSLADSIALVAASRGVVSNDSGLMHIAAAVAVPQVVVFGSTDPTHAPPLNDRSQSIWLKSELGLDCMPCMERTCRYGHYLCLTGVAAERVEAALTSIDFGPKERAVI